MFIQSRIIISIGDRDRVEDHDTKNKDRDLKF